MNLASIILLLLILIPFILVVRGIIKGKHKGCSCGSCDACSACSKKSLGGR